MEEINKLRKLYKLKNVERMNSVGKRKESSAMKKMEKEMPASLGKKAALLFKEFEECRTMEAKFARAIDQLDAVIHEMDYKADWKGWTKEFLIEKKGKYFEHFPELKKAFEATVRYVEMEGYFSQ
ncbi:MAG: HD domain-containing protein [Nanoarchaeota archaeon]|nr:HD domain-containing protein [Nanoarchaeota archaeon]